MGKAALTGFEQLLALFTRIRPGEGRSLALFFVQGFLLLFSYYVVRAVREAVILTEFSAVVRSYAVAAIAVVLMALIPLYSLLRRRLGGERLVQVIIAFFALNLLAFYLFGLAGQRFGFAFFVWVGLFGVMLVAQFWAFTTDTFNLKSGQRLFPLIMIGANLGALAGAQFARLAVGWLGTYGLMLAATVVLAVAPLLCAPARRAAPDASRSLTTNDVPPKSWTGGFSIVLGDRYLLLIALFVVLLNWINTTGGFVLAGVVQERALQLAAGPEAVEPERYITEFYGSFMSWVTASGFAIQALLVARMYRILGLGAVLLIPPLLAVFSYGLMAFVPIFSIIQIVKILEDSVNYSLGNTNRQALFLPTSPSAKYDGKTTIETFFWRFGDLIQAGAVYVGVNLLAWGTTQFAALNLVLAFVWLGLAVAIGREYRRQALINVINVPPELARPLADLHFAPGRPFRYSIPEDAFVDADPGDVLTLSARRRDGGSLPAWVAFDASSGTFSGRPPMDSEEALLIEVVATDVDGYAARGFFAMRRTIG